MVTEQAFEQWYAQFQAATSNYGWKPELTDADREWAFDEWQEYSRTAEGAAYIFTLEQRDSTL